MKGYKGFEKGLKCRGKQYAENTVFEEEKAEICECGIHFCKEPLDVLGYYPLVNENGEVSEFAEVEALDESLTDDNKKFCTKKIKIGSKIGFEDLVKASVNLECEKELDYFFDARIGSSGDSARIGSSGNDAQIGSSGNDAQIGSSGYRVQLGSSGNDAQIGSSGNFARIGSSGNSARIVSSGDSDLINSTGKNSVIVCAGGNCKAKGKIGSWITLAEWIYDKEECSVIPICVKTERIDGERIKEDVYYMLRDGEFVEIKE